MKIELREPRLSDAKRYVEILSHPEFHYFAAKPATVKEQKDYLRKSKKLKKSGILYDFAIIAKGKHVGAAGIKIIEQHPHICNVGYFVDCAYWNNGIATKAVGLLEDYIAKELKDIVRIEIVTAKGNVPSQKVALKHGYKKEGLMRSYLKIGEKIHDCYLFAKILK